VNLATVECGVQRVFKNYLLFKIYKSFLWYVSFTCVYTVNWAFQCRISRGGLGISMSGFRWWTGHFNVEFHRGWYKFFFLQKIHFFNGFPSFFAPGSEHVELNELYNRVFFVDLCVIVLISNTKSQILKKK